MRGYLNAAFLIPVREWYSETFGVLRGKLDDKYDDDRSN